MSPAMFLFRFEKKYSYSSDINTWAQEHSVKQLSGNIVNMQIIAFCFYYTTSQLFWNPIVVVSNSFIDDNIFYGISWHCWTRFDPFLSDPYEGEL